MKWLIPLGFLTLGLHLSWLALDDYHGWRASLELGDPSGAEIHEVPLWGELPGALALILLAAFLAGRWSVRK